jgi:hypothetical protein
MKKRSPAAVLLLPFITFGIYCIYWLYATRKELVMRTGNWKSIPPVSFMFLPFIGLALFIAAMFIVGASLDSSSSARAFIGFVSFVAAVFGFIGLLALPLWWFWRYCQVTTEQTRTMDFAQMYVLYVVITWVCGLLPVWMLIVQLDLNKMIDRDAAHHHHEPPHHIEHHHPAPQV